MGKQKGFRKIQAAPKKIEKREAKASKNCSAYKWTPKERYPLLARAIYLGCEKAIDELLEAGEDVNERIQDGSTPVMIAVDKRATNFTHPFRKIPERRLQIENLGRNNGMNALMLAVSKNDNRIFTLLWNHLDKNDIWILNQENSDGYTILTIAVERGYVEYAKFFSGINVVKVDHQTSEGKSSLMLAAMRSQSEIVKCLLERGASVLLEDMIGTTALCAAFVQDQPEIAEMLLEALNKKDRDIYVKKRIELLYRPRACSSFEISYFYKNVLFRVILSIKRRLENGVEFLIKYKIFFALLKCIEMNKIDSELVWQAFHLAACLMYDSIPNNTLVLKNMAELYVEAKGLDFSLKTFSCFKNNSEIKNAAFLPVQACCIECCQGRLWLKENFCRIRKHVNEFKNNLPSLKLWHQEEFGKAKVVYDHFEMIIKSITTEKEDLIIHQTLPATYNDSLDSFDSSLESGSVADSFESAPISTEVKPPRVASSAPLASASTQVKKRAEISRKVKNIKFHTKFEKKSKTSTASQKINVNFPIEVFQNSSKRLNLPALNSQTGYADALKRNLNHKTESEMKAEHLEEKLSGSLLGKINTEKDSSMKQNIPGVIKYGNKTDHIKQKTHLSAESDINENMVSESKSYASVVSKNSETRSMNALKNVKSDPITGEEKSGTLNEISNIWNKVKEPYKLFSFITKLYPSSNNTSDDQKATSHAIYEDERQFPGLLNSPLDQEEMGNEITCSYDKDADFKENDILKDISTEKKECSECNAGLNPLQGIKDYCLDFQSKEKHVEVEAENLFCLFESLNLTEKNSENIAVNYSGGDMDFERFDDEEQFGNHALKLIKDDNTLKHNHETGDTLQFEIPQVGTKRLNKNGRIDERYRKASHRTYCEVARTSINKRAEIINIPPKDGGNEHKQKFGEAEQDDMSLNSSHESLEFMNFCKIMDVEMNSEKPCSDNEDNGEKLETGETDFNMSLEDTSDFESEDISQIQINNPDLPICKNSESEPVDSQKNFVQLKIDDQENETPASNFNQFPIALDNLDESNIINTKVMKNSDSSFNENYGIESLNNNYVPTYLESIKQSIVTIEDLNISPVASQIKLLRLQKYLTLYQRMFLHSVYTRGVQNGPDDSKIDSKKFVNNSEPPFVKPIKKKITVFTDNRQYPNIVIKIGKKSAVGVGAHNSEDSNYIKFCNKLSKMAKAKIHKHCRDFSQLRTKKLTPLNDTEIKRKTAREETLIKRRASFMSENYINSGASKNRYNLDSGFMPHFINCESSSKWYHALKGLQSCVPLGQFLADSFPPEEMEDANVRRLDSAIGKIVFATKLECTLREGTFGTYTGLIVNTGTPVRIRQFGISSFITDRAALSLSKTRLLKHEKLAAFHPSNIMVTSDYKLKLSDYFLLDIASLSWGIRILDPKIRPIGSAISKFCWRPTELILAENETDARACVTAASDIQMCGMLIFYILTGGKHPFGSSERECQENIKQAQPVMGSYLEDTEARDLVCETIKSDASARPTIDVVAKHPYFWDINKRFQFLLQVGRKITFYTSRPTRAAEEFKESCIEARDWHGISVKASMSHSHIWLLHLATFYDIAACIGHSAPLGDQYFLLGINTTSPMFNANILLLSMLPCLQYLAITGVKLMKKYSYFVQMEINSGNKSKP
ncbi:Serine/threonine-protein kinase ppk4 like protein [Argiope bruennichi]|uniref:Serine/threonine-protein kinase ppk4 like protein n=1 Tax=Argiope bruennichi TaxID=94029 RepID=A0A8T0FEQ4_ARGBR|nr:Serine/threonine-protein kinase ppk4 like protein [Argiope bruennichi]